MVDSWPNPKRSLSRTLKGHGTKVYLESTYTFNIQRPPLQAAVICCTESFVQARDSGSSQRGVSSLNFEQIQIETDQNRSKQIKCEAGTPENGVKYR